MTGSRTRWHNVCGIAGLIGLPRRVATPRVTEAIHRVRHRGPDDDGCHEDEEAVLAMCRLSIIDVEGGHQPIYNEDRSIVVVCNGEIYNYVELLAALRARGHRFQSHCDVNVVAHLYEEKGVAAVHDWRGMFAAAVWDKRQRRLTLFRDRAGKKPLFYAQVGPGLAFASELPALLALLNETPQLSQNALAAYLRLGFVPDPWTIYEGVWALSPGCSLSFAPGEAPTVSQYWDFVEPAPFRGSREDALEQLERRLRESVEIRLRSDVPVGLFLSGGVDSGLVAAYAAAAGARDLMCFVIEVPDAALNEAPAARQVAQHLGLEVRTIELSYAPADAIERVALLYGQPFGDSSAIPSYYVAEAARAHRKVVLNGDGGDEVFAGYRRHWLGRASPWLLPLTAPIRGPIAALGRRFARANERRSARGFTARALRGLALGERERYLVWTTDLLAVNDVRRCFPELAATEAAAPDGFPFAYPETIGCKTLRQFLRSDFRLILAGDLLPKIDIATMAHGVEARSPLLDIPLIEFSWTLPSRWLMNLRETKPLLRSLARRCLPRTVVDAPKRGFEVPVRRWLRDDLQDLVGDLLLARDSRLAAFGAPAALRDFVLGRDGFVGNRAQVVWSLLMLELFLRAPTPPPSP